MMFNHKDSCFLSSIRNFSSVNHYKNLANSMVEFIVSILLVVVNKSFRNFFLEEIRKRFESRHSVVSWFIDSNKDYTDDCWYKSRYLDRNRLCVSPYWYLTKLNCSKFRWFSVIESIFFEKFSLRKPAYMKLLLW